MLATNTQSRADAILAKVDDHLDGLPPGSARAKFLAQQIAAWEGRYSRFVAGDGLNWPADVQAADFLSTIAGLNTRMREAARG